MGFRVQGSELFGFRVLGFLGFSLGFRTCGLEPKAELGLRFRIRGFLFRVFGEVLRRNSGFGLGLRAEEDLLKGSSSSSVIDCM